MKYANSKPFIIKSSTTEVTFTHGTEFQVKGNVVIVEGKGFKVSDLTVHRLTAASRTTSADIDRLKVNGLDEKQLSQLRVALKKNLAFIEDYVSELKVRDSFHREKTLGIYLSIRPAQQYPFKELKGITDLMSSLDEIGRQSSLIVGRALVVLVDLD